jgi:hypothetical protein
MICKRIHRELQKTERFVCQTLIIASREQSGGGEAEEMGLAMFSFAAVGNTANTASPSSNGGIFSALSSFGSAIMPPFLTPSFWSGSGAVAATPPTTTVASLM